MSDNGSGGAFDVSDDVGTARERVIEGLERTADIYGLNRSYGRLYGLLYFADEPVSLDELVQESGYAKSTVSDAMREMERLHMVYRRSIPGEGRRAYYSAERDFWTIVREILRGEIQREITVMTRALEDAEELLEDADHEQAEVDLEKVRKMERLYRTGDQLVTLLARSSVDRLAGVVEALRRE